MSDSTAGPASAPNPAVVIAREPVRAPEQGGAAPGGPVASAEPDAGVTTGSEGKAARIAAFVEAWWGSHFPGSAVARTTEAWNVAHTAKEDLKSRLQEI